jgi:hypothetical protein
LLALFFSVSVGAQPLGILSPQSQQQSQQKILASSKGRFVFGQVSDSSKDQFMLDTSTGRLWRIAEKGDIGIFLRSVPYRNSKGECSPLPEEIRDSQRQETKKP